MSSQMIIAGRSDPIQLSFGREMSPSEFLSIGVGSTDFSPETGRGPVEIRNCSSAMVWKFRLLCQLGASVSKLHVCDYPNLKAFSCNQFTRLPRQDTWYSGTSA